MCKNCMMSGSCSGECQCKKDHPEYDWDWDDMHYMSEATNAFKARKE